jgi:hypothetical protein
MMRSSGNRARLAAFLVLVPTSSGSRIAVAEIEINGPFEGATLDVPSQGRTRIEGHLLAHESRVLTVPVPASATGVHLEPRVRLDRTGELESPSGRLRVVDWRNEDASDFRAVPPGLLVRPRPPLASADPSAESGVLLLLAASFVCGLALRQKPRAALAFGVASGALAFALGPRSSDASLERVSIEEGDAQSSVWLEVHAARDRMSIQDRGESFRVETRPDDAFLECRVVLDDPAAWEARARRTALYEIAAIQPGDRAFTRAANHWGDLDETWVREQGSWTARGIWMLGEPLPPARAESPPPGWLASGLPQGTPILLGRLRTRPGESRVYLRMSGL